MTEVIPTPAARTVSRHIGFLALQAPELSPSQRYRVEAFAPYFRGRGFDIRYDWVLDRDDLRVFYGRAPAWQKAGVAARAALRRAGHLRRWAGIDVWLVQREAFFLGDAWSERRARRRAPVVFDFDDAIWIKATSAANSRFAWLKNVDKVARIAGMAHTVVAGNAYLAEWARRHAARVVVIPTCVDTAQFTPPAARPAGEPVVVGWSGSGSTVQHLRPLMPVLERLVRARPGQVVVRVMGDPAFSHAPLGVQGEAWSPGAELDLLRRMDIGLMPLPDDPWTRGKCGLKGLVAMAVGAATVMSPVGVNREIVRHGENGFLAATDDEWLDILVQLVDDAALRDRVGRAGRSTVVQHYSVVRWAPALADVFEAAVGRR